MVLLFSAMIIFGSPTHPPQRFSHLPGRALQWTARQSAESMHRFSPAFKHCGGSFVRARQVKAQSRPGSRLVMRLNMQGYANCRFC